MKRDHLCKFRVIEGTGLCLGVNSVKAGVAAAMKHLRACPGSTRLTVTTRAGDVLKTIRRKGDEIEVLEGDV